MTLYSQIRELKLRLYGDKDWMTRLSELQFKRLSEFGLAAKQERVVDDFLETRNQCLTARNLKTHRNTVSRELQDWLDRHAMQSTSVSRQ